LDDGALALLPELLHLADEPLRREQLPPLPREHRLLLEAQGARELARRAAELRAQRLDFGRTHRANVAERCGRPKMVAATTSEWARSGSANEPGRPRSSASARSACATQSRSVSGIVSHAMTWMEARGTGKPVTTCSKTAWPNVI